MAYIGMIGTAVTVAFAVVLFLFLLTNILKGLSKGLIPMIVRTVFIFVSGLLAIAVAVPLGRFISGYVIGYLNTFVESALSGFGDFISASPVIEDLIIGIPAVTVSVILYEILFLLFLAIMAIPSHFVKKALKKCFPKAPKLGWVGALCGIVAGLALFVFLTAPLVGTLDTVGDTASVVVDIFADKGESDDDETDNGEYDNGEYDNGETDNGEYDNGETDNGETDNGEYDNGETDNGETDNGEYDNGEYDNGELYIPLDKAAVLSAPGAVYLTADGELDVYGDIIAPVTDNFFVRFAADLGGRAIFNALTVLEVNGEKVSIAEEISVMADVFSSLRPVLDGGAPSEWTQEDISGIKDATSKLSKSKLVTSILADVISNAADKWSRGEEFLGMKMPASGRPSVDEFLTELFTAFATTTPDTVGEDIGTLADILGQLQKYGILGGANATDSIATDGFVSGLLEIIISNERFRGATAAVINLGVYETLEILDVPATNSDVYDSFVSDIAGIINDANVNGGSIDEAVFKSFEKHGIDADRTICDYVSQYLALDFEGRTDVTADEVGEFFAIAFATLGDGASELSADGYGNGAAYLTGDYSGADELNDVLAELKGSHGSDLNWGYIETLVSRDLFRSSSVTADSLKVSVESINAMSDQELRDECKRIEDIIKNMMSFSKSVSGENIIESADLAALGDALNGLSASALLGDVSKDLINSALNSEMVQNNITISKDTVDSMVNSEDTDYNNILVSVQNTAGIISGLSKEDGNLSDEEIDEKLEFLLNDMTGSTEEVIGGIFDSENVEKLGIPNDKADKIADSVNVFFVKMAESDADVSDPEDKDVKATKTVFKFITAANGSSGNFLEESGMTVADTVHIFMDSDISRETLISASYSESGLELDAFGVGEKLSIEDKNDAINILADEVAENYTSAEDKEEYRKAVCAVGAILGVDVSSQFDSWIG